MGFRHFYDYFHFFFFVGFFFFLIISGDTNRSFSHGKYQFVLIPID